MTDNIESLKAKLIELDPYMIVLFGSHASGVPNKNSDIDLLVVTNDDFIPANFDEQLNLQLTVSNHIFELAKKVPVDLIVYSIPMYRKFIEQNSVFAHEINTRGKILYERGN